MKKLYVLIFLSLIALSYALTFGLPVSPATLQKYGVSVVQARLLNLTILIPLTFIYLVALYGFLRVYDYSQKVLDTKEGPYFRRIAQGLMVLAFSLPVSSVISSARAYIVYAYPHFLSDITIARSYINTLLIFVAMYLIALGAEGLYNTLKKKTTFRIRTMYGILPLVAFASIYTWIVASRGLANPSGEPYYLPGWLVITTIVIPQLFSWCFGAWAAYNLYRYQTMVKGMVYRRALNGIAKGVAAIVIVAALLQFLTPLQTALNRLDLGPLLIITYVILASYIIGFGLVARGARKLKRIEEV